MSIEQADSWTPELTDAINLLVAKYGGVVAIRATGLDDKAYKHVAKSFGRLNIRARWLHQSESEILALAARGFVGYPDVLYFSRIGDTIDPAETFHVAMLRVFRAPSGP